jgi:hypothetical protein
VAWKKQRVLLPGPPPLSRAAYDAAGRRYLVYNGNAYSATAIRYAVEVAS